jgi:hypothetical protein
MKIFIRIFNLVSRAIREFAASPGYTRLKNCSWVKSRNIGRYMNKLIVNNIGLGLIEILLIVYQDMMVWELNIGHCAMCLSKPGFCSFVHGHGA